MTRRNVLLVSLIAFFVPLLCLGASKQEEAARYYEDALKRYQQDDASGAAIQLKNALQREPGMLAARVLLGKAYLQTHDSGLAEQELTKAAAAGADRSEIVIPLARALQNQGKHRELLNRFTIDRLPVAQQVDLLLLRGQSYRALGDPNAALREYQSAATLDSNGIAALLAQADVLASQGNSRDASAVMVRALELAPTNPIVWNVKAAIAQGCGDPEGALTAYARAIELDTHSSDARIGRAALLLGLQRDSEAATDIKYLQREAPKEPRGIYLRAVLASRKGDDPRAREALNQIATLIDPIPRLVLQQEAAPLLMMGGLARYGLGDTEKARSYFQDYLSVDPGNAGARKLLGSLLLGQGDTKSAIATLEIAQRAAPNDPQVLTLLAIAQMERGQYRVAQRYLEQALQIGGENPDVQSTLGFTLLGLGQRELALNQLRRAFAKDPAQYRVGAALAVLYLRSGQPKDAIAVAELVAQRDPSNVLVLNLVGVAKAAGGDRAGARAAYGKALSIDPSFVAAQLNLARLDLVDGNTNAARERLTTILRALPKNSRAMYELALVEDAAGKPEEAVRWLTQAHEIDRRDIRSTIRLVELQLRLKDADAAVSAALETQMMMPDNLEALGALGSAYAAADKLNQARTTFERMELVAGADADWQYRIAGYQASTGNWRAAIRCLSKALSAQPNNLPAQVLLSEVYLRSGDSTAAEQRARAVANSYPKRGVGKRLLADIAMVRKNYAEAIAGYQAALKTEPNIEGAIRLFGAYIESGNLAKANEHLEAWVRSTPNDITAMRALAEGYLRADNLSAARAWYEKIVGQAGEQPSILNNLANILLRQRDAKALSYAERAHALSPNDAAVLDTLGWVLVQQGQANAGLRYLREARVRRPNSHEIRYHLAVALNAIGRPDEARSELELLTTANADFDGAADARKLWQHLSKQ